MSEAWRIYLPPAAVEQLMAIESHGMTQPGDLISKDAKELLRQYGLIAYMDGWLVITEDGEKWLRCAGLVPSKGV